MQPESRLDSLTIAFLGPRANDLLTGDAQYDPKKNPALMAGVRGDIDVAGFTA